MDDAVYQAKGERDLPISKLPIIDYKNDWNKEQRRWKKIGKQHSQ